MIASALKMVISQRLIKKICPHCKKVHHIDEILKSKVRKELSDIIDEWFDNAMTQLTGLSGRAHLV